MKVVVKVGGAQLEDVEARAAFARAVAAARDAGHSIVLVHGGGNQIRRLTDKLALGATRRVRGLRVTDRKTADAALMVLGGQVNRTLVHALEQAGASAIGLTGADGSMIGARPIDPELGFVGDVHTVDARALLALIGQGFVPVVATIAPLAATAEGDDAAFYNINADHVVAPLARAFGADAVLFLTNVASVRGADGEPIERLDPAACQRLIDEGVIAGGMIPKVETACTAAEQNPKAMVRIADASRDDALLAALDPTAGGTTFSCTEEQTTHG